MKYVRPKIESLGEAGQLIQSLGKIGQNMDPFVPSADPAYDLDE